MGERAGHGESRSNHRASGRGVGGTGLATAANVKSGLGGYNPDRGRKQYSLTPGKGGECLANRLGCRCDYGGRLLRKRAGGWPDLKSGLRRRLQTAPDREVERDVARLHHDLPESCLAEDAADALLRRERERTRIFGTELGQLRDMFVGGLERRHEKRVLPRLLPACEHQ